mgnify:FL=1
MSLFGLGLMLAALLMGVVFVFFVYTAPHPMLALAAGLIAILNGATVGLVWQIEKLRWEAAHER